MEKKKSSSIASNISFLADYRAAKLDTEQDEAKEEQENDSYLLKYIQILF